MKFSDVVVLATSVNAVLAAPHDGRQPRLLKRQQLDGQLTYLVQAAPKLQEMKPAKTTALEPISGRPNAKRMKLYFGPFQMRGANEPKPDKEKNPMALDPNSSAWNNWVSGFPLDATWLYHKTAIELENGKVASLQDGVYNHHLAYVSTKKIVPQFMQCPGQGLKTSTTPATVAGATQERGESIYTTTDYKFNSGSYMRPDDKIVVTGELVNYSNHSLTVYAVTDLEWIPGKPSGVMDVVTQILSVNQCEGGDLNIHPPKGQTKYSLKSQNMTALMDGVILASRAHLHDGGENLELWVNDKLVCDSTAIYGGAGGTRTGPDGKVWETMSGVKECNEPVKVKKGEKIFLQSNYDLVKHPARTFSGDHGKGMDHGDKAGGGHNDGMAEEMALMSFSFAMAG